MEDSSVRMVEVKIHVTQKDIDQGLCMHCRECPIALAAHRALGRIVQVTRHRLAISTTPVPDLELLPPVDRRWVYAPMPDEAVAFIAAFDTHRRVKPFTFVVVVPGDLCQAP